MTRPSGAAKLPGLPVVNTGNASLDRWIQAVSERLEVREGARGNPKERAVLLRELEGLGLTSGALSAAGRSSDAGGVMVKQPDGSFAAMSVDAFADGIRSTRLYKDLLKRLDDVTRFDDVPSQVRAILLNDIALEAQKRGADIQRLEYKLQSATESLAYTVQEVTASVAGSMAGVRETTYASADANRATAGKVTQLVASLDGTGSASIEESLVVIADRTEGLRAQAMLKLNAGKAVTGYGLMASEDPGGVTQSKFIVQADQFALTGTYTYMQGDASSTPPATPPSAATAGQTWYNTRTNLSYRAAGGIWVAYAQPIPFGVDMATNITYINGQLRVNSGGLDLATVAANAAVAAITFIGDYSSAPATALLKKNNVYRNTTDGNSYILSADAGTWGLYIAKGTNGTNGAAGARGTAFITSTAASATDSAFVAAGGPNPPIAGDQLMLSNSAAIWTRGASSWTNTTALVVNGDAIISGTLAASKVAAGVLSGFTIQTAPSGSRWSIEGGAYAMQMRGFNSIDVLTSTFDSVSGTITMKSPTAESSEFDSDNASFTLRGDNGGSGAGLAGRSSSGVGVDGKSDNYIGGAFYGGSNAPPLYLNPNGSLPTAGAIAGSLCVVGSALYFHNGSTWKQVSLL